MGHEVYITRRERLDDYEPLISDAEFIAAAEAEPGFHVLTREEEILLGARPDDPWPASAEWTTHSSGQTVWFHFENGQAMVINPDAETVARMEVLATRLGARLLHRDR